MRRKEVHAVCFVIMLIWLIPDAAMVSSGETRYKTEKQESCEVDSNRPCRHRLVNEEGKNILHSECFNSSNDVFCRFECEFAQNTGNEDGESLVLQF